ncbi:hypothetical protein ACW2Q0_21135 [Nocardia sp. R16R-3T]
MDDVARSVSATLGKIVSAAEVDALRTGAHDDRPFDTETLTAIAQHFQVPAVYLNGDDAAAAAIDRELRLLAAARDAGVRHLALRGDEVDIEKLAGEFSRLADDPQTPDQDN